MEQIKISTEEELKIFTQEIKRFFTKDELEQLARKVGFVQRKGKLEAWEFVALSSFMDVNIANDTLLTLVSTISANNGETVTCQAIDQRLNEKCVVFLKEIFKKLLKETVKIETEIPNEFNRFFKRIRILDSTGFQLPEKFKDIYPGSGGNSSSAGAKIQLEFELASGDFTNIEITSGKDSDCTYAKILNETIEPGDLILRDLGYFNLDDYENINNKEAFYISKIKLNTAVYVLNDNAEYFSNGMPKKSSIYKKIDFLEVMNTIKEGEIIEIGQVFVGEEKKMPTRLIVYRYTKEQLKKIIGKVKKDSTRKGKKKSEKTMEILGINIFITNISNKILTAKQVCEIYTLRWQVELIFKIWKSVFHVQKVKPVKIERFQCQLYGKLILLLLSSTIMFKMRLILLLKQKKEASEIKLAEIVVKYIKEIYVKIINSSYNEILNLLMKIFKNALKNGTKSHRKNKKTIFDILGISYSRSERRSKAA